MRNGAGKAPRARRADCALVVNMVKVQWPSSVAVLIRKGAGFHRAGAAAAAGACFPGT